METVALSISHNANQIAYSIRGDLRADTERPQAVPKLDETADAKLYVTPSAAAHIAGAVGSPNALDQAKQDLIQVMSAFPYEAQA